MSARSKSNLKPKAREITAEVVRAGKPSSPSVEELSEPSLVIQTRLVNVTPLQIVGWLKAAVPAFTRSRARLAKEAVAIGVALIAVRDFSPRGTLDAVKNLVRLNKSSRSLDRCISMAQKFLGAHKMLDARSHKLLECRSVAGLFQSEFNFEKPEDDLMLLIAGHVGESTLQDLLEADIIGTSSDERKMPLSTGGGRKKLTKDEQQRADFEKAFLIFKQVWAGGRDHLWNKDLLQVEVWLNRALDEVRAENKHRTKLEGGRRSCGGSREGTNNH